jgi:hypothetical protein
LFLLAAVLAACAGEPGSAPPAASPCVTAATAAATPQSQPAAIVDTPGDGIGIIRGPATPWAVPGGPGEPTLTAEGPAELTGLPGASPAIVLQGPPPGSSFNLGDTISFYWQAAGEVAPQWRMTLYIESDGGSRAAAGSVARANLGQGFRLDAVAGDIVDEAGAYRWFVALEDSETGAIIGQSELRPLVVMGEN